MRSKQLTELVREKYTLVDLLQKDGVVLKSEGAGRYTCRCPFHAEKTPSFKVNTILQRYKCFGCGASGDVIAYYAHQNQLDYQTAKMKLAEQAGIQLTEVESDDYKKKKRFLELVQVLYDYYQDNFTQLAENHPAKEQIRKRGLQIEKDIFGYAPNNNQILTILKQKGFTEEELKEAGYLTENGYSLLRDRLIFTFKNYLGEPIGFSGRALVNEEKGWKYVNSKSSIVFDKSNSFYALERAKKSIAERKEVYLVEGQFDVEAMHQNGYPNTVAISGTAFTKGHLHILNRCLGNGNIILCFDSDTAGKKSAIKVFQNFPEIHNRLYVCFLPKGKDPCEYLQTTKEFPKPIQFVHYLYEYLKHKYPLTIVENRRKFVEEVQDKITQYMTDNALKEVYLQSATSLAGIPRQSVKPKQVKQYEEANQEDNQSLQLSPIDEIFTTALAFYIQHFMYLTGHLFVEDYPKQYKPFVQELLKNLKTVFEVEQYTNQRLANYLATKEVEEMTHQKWIVLQYQSLIKQAHRLYKKEQQAERCLQLKQSLQNHTPEEFIRVLKGDNIVNGKSDRTNGK